MTLHVHALRGCAPAPLAHYLKALAILRLVAEQPDAGARGYWKDDVFHLVTTLDREALLRFVCDEYEPTPMLSPWNGGSGFYPKDAKDGIDAIASSATPRFEPFRQAIAKARSQVGDRAKRPDGDEKFALLAECASAWSEPAAAWFGAAVALDANGEPSYPALLGTGGNDGRLDFTNNAMQRLTELIDPASGLARERPRALASLALFGEPTRGLESDLAIGQFLPGAAGGANATSGFDAASLINPWDFVLMLEGAIVFRVAALRRLQGSDLVQAAAPFALRGVCEGYASATASDASTRGEQWVPLWARPATFAEVARLFAEARLVTGRNSAQNALDAVRAVASFGTDRGVSAFERFAFLERNGQSNLAVPLGAISVRAHSDVRLVEEIDGWLDRLRRAARDKTAPAVFAGAARRLEGLALSACTTESPRLAWEALLIELGAVEDLLASRPHATPKLRMQPVPALSPGWLAAIADGSAEQRIALAIASQHDAKLGPIRAHCIPLDLERRWPAFATAGSSDRPHLVADPRVVWRGADLATDLASVALRRAMEGRRAGAAALPLHGRAYASAGDVSAFLDGALDDARIARLARGMMALDFAAGPSLPTRGAREPRSALHALIRVAYLPHRVANVAPRCDPGVLRLLTAGRVSDAVEAAARQLVSMGLRAKIRVSAGDERFAMRLAATAAIPVDERELASLLDLVSKPFVSTTTPEAP